MSSPRPRWGRILLPILFGLAPVTEAQTAGTRGWVLGLESGAAVISFDGDPADGAALVGLRIGYRLNRVIAPYLGGAYADIRTRGLEAFDRVTFSHVDVGVRLHLAGRRRWVPYGDLALTYWRVSDVVENGKQTAAGFTSAPTLGAGGGLVISLSESWALDVNVKAAAGTFENVPAGNAPGGGTTDSGALLHPDAASVRLGAGVSWRP